MRKLDNLEEIDPERSSFIKELRKELKQKYNQSKRRKSINWEEAEKEYVIKEMVKQGMKSKRAANQTIRDFSRPLPPSFSLSEKNPVNSNRTTRSLRNRGPIYGNINRWNKKNKNPRNKNGGYKKSTRKRSSKRKRRRKSRRKRRRKSRKR